jgi:hypothetical protein
MASSIACSAGERKMKAPSLRGGADLGNEAEGAEEMARLGSKIKGAVEDAIAGAMQQTDMPEQAIYISNKSHYYDSKFISDSEGKKKKKLLTQKEKNNNIII